MYFNLTGRQILEIAQFMGMEIALQTDEDVLDTEVTLEKGNIYDANGLVYKDGLLVYLTDYPEEGSIGLEEEKYV